MLEGLEELVDAGGEDLGETQERRETHAPASQPVRQLVEVDALVGAVRMDAEMALRIDTEEARAPRVDAVEALSIPDREGHQPLSRVSDRASRDLATHAQPQS